jgi:hypothetical protein
MGETREERAARKRRNAENHARLLAGELSLTYVGGEKVYTPVGTRATTTRRRCGLRTRGKPRCSSSIGDDRRDVP